MKRQQTSRRRRWQWALVIALISVMWIGTGSAYAQSGITMLNTTIDGGGGNASGGQFSLGATIGQPDAGEMEGGTFTLIGGFWTPLGSGPTGNPDDDFRLVMPFVKGNETE